MGNKRQVGWLILSTIKDDQWDRPVLVRRLLRAAAVLLESCGYDVRVAVAKKKQRESWHPRGR